MNGKKELFSFLTQQDVKTKLDAINELMKSLSPVDHEMLILTRLEWFSPAGLDRAEEKVKELMDDFETDEPIEHTLPDIRVDLIRDDRLLEGLNGK